jgi:hypothetical protein
MQRKWITGRSTIAAALAAFALAMVGGWALYPYLSFPEMFRRSKPALEQYAAQVTAPGSTALTSPPKRLGYFKVLKTEPLPHGFLFQTDSFGGPFDWSGIAYSTEPLPHDNGHDYFKLIEGNWYSVDRQ